MHTPEPFAAKTNDDQTWMMRALTLARRGEGFVEPNPMVGCVIVRDGVCVAEGYHRRFGGDHAEVDALKSLHDVKLAKDATAFVTLEPCCHTGKTPPCTGALIAAGVSRVVIAMRDPFPQVDGGGIQQLRASGIEVVIGPCGEQAMELNAPYLKRLHSRRPWVIAKWAMSLDGRIATASGDSQWISGELSRGEVHRLRGRVDAIVVGGGTMVADDPTLTARPGGPRLATRIALVGRRLPDAQSRLIRTIDQAPVLIVTSGSTPVCDLDNLRRSGAEVFQCDAPNRGEMIAQLLDELGRREMTNILVEGGAETLASFSAIDELDEIHAYLAPKILGGSEAPGPIGGSGFEKLIDTPSFKMMETSRFDDDLRVVMRRSRIGSPSL